MNKTNLTIHNDLKGLIYIILAYLCFASLNIVTKALYIAEMSPMVITFYRSFFCILLTLPFTIAMLRRQHKLNFAKINVYKGIIDYLSIPVWVMAVSNINIPEAVGLSYITPMLTAILAIIFLKDKFSYDKWIVMAIGLIGVYIIVKPDSGNFNFYVIYVFIACILWAGGHIITKNLTSKQHPIIIVCLTNIVICVLATPFFIATPQFLNFNELLLCILMSGMAAGGYYFLAYACKSTKLSNLVPYDYLRLIFATILAYIFYDQVIDINTVVGSILIFGGATYLLRKQIKAI